MRFLFFTIFILLFHGLDAQQDAAFSHYMYNTLIVNPAYAGSKGDISANLLHRSQWVGFEGAPHTQTLTAHTPILNENAGAGISFISDRLGQTVSNTFFADFAYRIKFDEAKSLSFGAKLGIQHRFADFKDMNLETPDDPDFISAETRAWLPNIGLGIMYFTNRFYVGYSAPQIIQNDYEAYSGQTQSEYSGQRRHHYFILGSLQRLNRDWDFKGTMSARATNGAPAVFDLSAEFIYDRKFRIGTMFRYTDAIGIMTGFRIAENLYLGYAFDWSFSNKTMKYNYGSHEAIIRFVKQDKRTKNCPAYF